MSRSRHEVDDARHAKLHEEMRAKARAWTDRRDAERARAAGVPVEALRDHDLKMFLSRNGKATLTTADLELQRRLTIFESEGHVRKAKLTRRERSRVRARTRRWLRQDARRYGPVIRLRAFRAARRHRSATRTSTRAPASADADPPPPAPAATRAA